MEKKKVIKIILFIVLILVVIFVGNIIRKMIILKDISDNFSKYINNGNHYEKIINSSEESKTITEYYCKGNKEVMFLTTTFNDSNKERKLTQYFDGEKCNTYFETENDKVATLNSNTTPIKVLIGSNVDYNDSLWNLFYLALTTPIESVKYNNKECYFLNSEAMRECYVEKETGLTLRAIDGRVLNSDGTETDIVNEYSYEFDNVDDSIFVEPDISEYKIQENK